MVSYRDRSEYFKAHYLKNKEAKDAYAKKYREENLEASLEANRRCGKKRFQENKSKIYEYRNEKYKTDLNFRLSEVLRSRFKKLVKGESKKENALSLVGCSLQYLKQHLESKFKEGMTWDNYGQWHIDHIKPCASFDLNDIEQQKECFNYKNLQPLWAIDNHKKGART